jgi:hypothetical protein
VVVLALRRIASILRKYDGIARFPELDQDSRRRALLRWQQPLSSGEWAG